MVDIGCDQFLVSFKDLWMSQNPQLNPEETQRNCFPWDSSILSKNGELGERQLKLSEFCC